MSSSGDSTRRIRQRHSSFLVNDGNDNHSSREIQNGDDRVDTDLSSSIQRPNQRTTTKDLSLVQLLRWRRRRSTTRSHRIFFNIVIIIIMTLGLLWFMGMVWMVVVSTNSYHNKDNNHNNKVMALLPPRISRYSYLDACLTDISKLPFLWLPPPGVDEDYADEPWSPEETDLAQLAVKMAWKEWSEVVGLSNIIMNQEKVVVVEEEEEDSHHHAKRKQNIFGDGSKEELDLLLFELMEWTDVLIEDQLEEAIIHLRHLFLQASRRLLGTLSAATTTATEADQRDIQESFCDKGQVHDPVPWMHLANYGNLLVDDLLAISVDAPSSRDEDEDTQKDSINGNEEEHDNGDKDADNPDNVPTTTRPKKKLPADDLELLQTFGSVVNATRDNLQHCIEGSKQGDFVDYLLNYQGIQLNNPIATSPEVWETFSEMSIDDIIRFMEVARLMLQANALPELSEILLKETGMASYITRLWISLEDYPFQYGTANANHFSDPKLLKQAQWASTHLATFATGHFQLQRMTDTPTWYPYLRDNFYFAIETEELELIADFLEWIRSYGCKETDDYQLRQGTRYILNAFEDHDRTWAHWTEKEKDGSQEHRRLLLAASKAVGVDASWADPTEEGTYTRGLYEILISQGYYRQAAVAKESIDQDGHNVGLAGVEEEEEE